jgi:hypothetical protein
VRDFTFVVVLPGRGWGYLAVAVERLAGRPSVNFYIWRNVHAQRPRTFSRGPPTVAPDWALRVRLKRIVGLPNYFVFSAAGPYDVQRGMNHRQTSNRTAYPARPHAADANAGGSRGGKPAGTVYGGRGRPEVNKVDRPSHPACNAHHTMRRRAVVPPQRKRRVEAGPSRAYSSSVRRPVQASLVDCRPSIRFFDEK